MNDPIHVLRDGVPNRAVPDGAGSEVFLSAMTRAQADELRTAGVIDLVEWLAVLDRLAGPRVFAPLSDAQVDELVTIGGAA